ncbi:MAG: type II toxin-antitoxin system prevent-host-death family antitoxin [Armatimonadota bacterium]|nr:type II toxin-antitoxin system prevent-host-death family antitoxin [Armatimonadota bacterium]
MNTITSKEAQNRFGELIDTAQREPVTINRRGRAVAVVLSNDRYRALEAMEDALWAARARLAAESGFVGTEESMSFIKEMLNADA